MASSFEGEWLELFEERAGILEFDGGYSREFAERLAKREVLNLQNRATRRQNEHGNIDV